MKAAVGEGEYVRLPKIRDALQAKGYSREEQDAALVGLLHQPDVELIEIANLKSLTPDDRRAAVLIGASEKHAIRIGAPQAPPARGGFKMNEQQRRVEIDALSGYLGTLPPGSAQHKQIQDRIAELRGQSAPRSRASIRKLEQRTLTNLERLTTRDTKPTAEQLRSAMPDMSAADLDFALEQLRKKGFLAQGDRLTVTALGRNRLSEPQAFRQPRAQFPRRRTREAAGRDITPGHDELHHYWTKDPEGLGKWIKSDTPWTTLVEHLTPKVGPFRARIYASRWFIEVFHFAAGSDKNRVAHGKPPRGHLVGPG